MHLWVCIYFRFLPVEVFSPLDADRVCEPRAVLSEQGRSDRVLVCNPAAAGLGIRPGQPVNAALALVPELQILARDVEREQAVLEELAAWAIRFTPAVSIAEPDALLLDVFASLKFFGGFECLLESLSCDLDARGYRVSIGCAPTALAALWLARTGDRSAVTDLAALSGRLSALPVECLHWPAGLLKLFRELGIQTLGESVRLPRKGFAQRFGPESLLELDRGFGRAPEALEFYQPPKTFRAAQDLPLETTDMHLLLECLRHLLDRLERFLVRNQAGIRTLWLHLQHRRMPPTSIRIGLLRPSIDTGYLLELARIRFSDMRFCAPAVSLALCTDLLESCQASGDDLFGASIDESGDGAASLALMEQLQARLEDPAIHGIRTVAEYRPESAWKTVAPAQLSRPCVAAEGADVPRRPLWLLSEPLALDTVADRPFFRGALDLEGSAERIETGWWDGRDVRRDYYVARPSRGQSRGMRLWVFRDCRGSRWYLHGFFG